MWIKDRIINEWKKHYRVTGGCDWSRLAEAKILSTLNDNVKKLKEDIGATKEEIEIIDKTLGFCTTKVSIKDVPESPTLVVSPEAKLTEEDIKKINQDNQRHSKGTVNGTVDICANCGHERRYHIEGKLNKGRCTHDNPDFCDCKKFKPIAKTNDIKGCENCEYYEPNFNGKEICGYSNYHHGECVEELPEERTCKDFSPKCEETGDGYMEHGIELQEPNLNKEVRG